MTEDMPVRYPSVTASEFVFVSHCPQKMTVKTQNLDIYEEVAYRRIVDQILTTGDRLEDNDKRLGYATKLGKAKWLKVKAVLIGQGLLQVEDGRITSTECQQQLSRVELQISQKSRAGKASAEARSAASNALKNKETDSTAVTRPVASAVGTKHETSRNDDNNAPAREEPSAALPVQVSVPEPTMARGGINPNVTALIDALTEEVKAAFGEEIGGMARPWTMGTDRHTAEMFLNAGKQLGVDAGEVIDGLRGHFQRQCRKLADKGRKPPKTLSMFEESGLEEIQKIAECRGKVSRPISTRVQSPRKPYVNGGDAPTPNTFGEPWQRVQKQLLEAKQIDAAKQLSAASKQGAAAANQLAAELEGRLLPKRHPAARAA